MNRRSFLASGAVLAGASLLPAWLPARDDVPKRQNFILCMADDLGWGDTGYNGHPVIRTPNLDKMAKEGLRLDRFYAAAPLCSPTRGSCITGRHPYRYGITNANVGHMKKDEMTLAEVLKPQGYSTGHFGKWHLGTLTKSVKDANRGKAGNTADYSPPWENGFDACFSTESKVPTYWKDGSYDKYGTHYWTGPEKMVPSAEIKGDDSTLIMDRALGFIRSAASDNKPFLAVIWFHAPHLPVISAPPYTDGYKENQDYYGCITAMDEQMGRLRSELQKLGVDKDTMIWFCSDNGPEGNEAAPGRTGGLRGRKRSLYEGGVRVPGLLVWPGSVKEGRAVSMPCSTSDYFPTVLDVLGHRLPAEMQRPYDGVSLLPMIRGEVSERPGPIGFQSQSQLSLVDNRYKLYSADEGRSYQLYDIIADPNEKNDIAVKHSDIVGRMKKTLEIWLESCRNSSVGADYRQAEKNNQPSADADQRRLDE